MIRSLARKELRSLLPFTVLILALSALEAGFILFAEQPDRYGLAHMVNSSKLEETVFSQLFFFVIAFTLGLGLLFREQDEGTVEFLDALPVTRNRVFAVKIFCALSILVLFPLIWNALGFLLQLWARDSLEPGFYLRDLARTFGVECALMAVYLGIGVGLSFLRRFAWLALALAFAAYLLLSALNVPGIELLNIFAVTNYAFEGQAVVMPWRQLGAASVLGISGYFAGWMLFHLQGDRLARWWGALERSGLKTLLLGAGLVLIVVLWSVILIYLSWKQFEDDPSLAIEDPMQAVVYPSWSTNRTERGSFEFVYPANLTLRAEALMNGAEEAEVKVRTFLQADPPGTIVADLASTARHAAATANWKRLNMDLSVSSESRELTAIFGHELVHVYIDSESEGLFHRKFTSTRWFHEGLASYLEHRLFRDAEQLARLRRAAAFAYDTKQADIEKLVDDAEWRRTHDSDLVYPLGEVFCQALVSLYGNEAPANLLRASTRPDRPSGLSGLDLWRDLFQACEYDFSAASAEYYALLNRLRDEHAAFIDSLPEINLRVSVVHDWITLDPVVDGELPDGAQIVARLRNSAEDPPPLYQMVALDETATPVTQRFDYPGVAVWIQVGIQAPECNLPLYGEWDRHTLN